MDNGESILANVVDAVFSPLYQLAVVAAIIYFLWGVLVFIWNIKNPDSADNEKRNDGKRHMLWGLIGLLIILSVGGILRVLNGILGGMLVF